MAFYRAAYGMQTRYSDENILYVRPSVRLSVCLSIKHVNCNKTEEKSVQIFIPYERPFSLLRKRKVGGAWRRPLLPEILSQRGRVGAK